MTEKSSGLKIPSRISKSTQGIPKPTGIKAPAASTTSASLSGDDFIIGDRVIVSGTKVGRILYLGTTKFAAGEWAGVVLDKPEGKNDGSVAGVRYFQCDPMHGVFYRPSKLVRESGQANGNESSAKSAAPKAARSSASVTASSSAASLASIKPAPLTTANVKAAAAASATPEQRQKPTSGLRSPASSIRSLRLGTPRASKTSLAKTSGAPPNVKIGDRVMVGETKIGTARFVGETEFAKGCWVGVELDEPLGKNDGSVNEKKYFTCAAKHGLFALIQKVQKLGFPSTTTARQRAGVKAGIRSPDGSIAGSVSSISSISSVKRPSKLRTEVSSRYQQKTAAGGVQALQEALNEKQQHVEALIAERDQERSELMEVNITAAEKHAQLQSLQQAFDAYVKEKEAELAEMRSVVERFDRERSVLANDLEEERQKVEDIQFRLEEEAICKDDLETELSELKGKSKERELSNSQSTKASDGEPELERLREELARAARKIQDLNTQLSESSNTETADEDARMFELEERLVEARSCAEDHEQALVKARSRLKAVESERDELLSAVHDFESRSEGDADTTTQLKAELEARINEEKEKSMQLGAKCQQLQEQLGSLMKDSGDNNSQLQSLTETLASTRKELNEVNGKLKDTTAECERNKAECEERIATMSSDLCAVRSQLAATEHANQQLTHAHDEAAARHDEKLARAAQDHDKLQRLNDQLSRLSEQTQEKLEALEGEKGELEARCQELLQAVAVAKQETVKAVEESENKEERLKEKLAKVSDMLEQTGEKLKNSESAQDQSIQQVTRLSEQLATLTKKHNDTQLTLNSVTQEAGQKTQTLVEQMQQAHERERRLQEDVAQQQAAIEKLEEDKKKLKKTCEELRTSLQQRDGEAKRIAERVSQLEELNSRLTSQGEESRSKLKAAEKKETVLKREFGEERKSLQRSLDCATALVDDKNREVETTRKEMELMRAEHVMTSSLRDSVAALENEKRLLQARVLHLESSSPAPAPFAPVVNGAESSGDTDFLNSVIVDQQQKIVKLKEKITELEHMMLNGDDDAVAYHGESDDPGRRMTPRLFCDICDVFDAHDTEDCPTQAMDESDQVGQGSTVRYQRGEERPYCDDCEVFGHWTSDCQEQEMF